MLKIFRKPCCLCWADIYWTVIMSNWSAKQFSKNQTIETRVTRTDSISPREVSMRSEFEPEPGGRNSEQLVSVPSCHNCCVLIPSIPSFFSSYFHGTVDKRHSDAADAREKRIPLFSIADLRQRGITL